MPLQLQVKNRRIPWSCRNLYPARSHRVSPPRTLSSRPCLRQAFRTEVRALPGAQGAPAKEDAFTDSFGPTFELVLTLLQRLDELQDAVEKIRSMDTIVAAVNRQLRIKYELKLEDVLPR